MFMPMVAIQSTAGNASHTTKINVGIRPNGNSSKPHRGPINVDIDVYYDADSQTLNVCLDGETEGEVFLYLDGTQVDYSPAINTSFFISTPGLYSIEIVTDSWTAEGQIVI